MGLHQQRRLFYILLYTHKSCCFFITLVIGYVTNTAEYIMPLRVITGAAFGGFLSSLFRLNTRMKNSKIWLSCNVSSIIGQVVDTTTFSFVTFYGLLSQFYYIWKSAIVIFLIKIISGIILTPKLHIIKTKIESLKN